MAPTTSSGPGEAAWQALAREVGASAGAAARDGRTLAARYAEPQRAYHTLEHVAAVLAWLDRLVAAGERVEDLWALRAAAWFHDAVYDPAAGDNEEASAALAEQVLARWGVAAPRRERVAALVLLTAHHDPARAAGVPPADAAVMADADLAVLAATPGRYDAYARAVRQEYAHLDDATFGAGRAAFCEAMLARPRLFHTAAMATAEATARANLERELASLRPA